MERKVGRAVCAALRSAAHNDRVMPIARICTGTGANHHISATVGEVIKFGMQRCSSICRA